MDMNCLPDPNAVFPNAFGTTCFLKNVVTAPNIFIGDYTYYDDPVDPTGFEANNVLFNWPEFGDKLIIGKFCAIARGIEFVMNGANHRMNSVTTYPFNLMGHGWEKVTPTLEQLPFKGNTVVGNDVWIGRESVILPGVHIGDGAIIAARSVVSRDIPPYVIAGGNPCRVIRPRFDPDLTAYLLDLKWWDWPPEKIFRNLEKLCSGDLTQIRTIE